MGACASRRRRITQSGRRSSWPPRATDRSRASGSPRHRTTPPTFLENSFGDLRNAGLVASRRGADGGYWLARPAEEISLADVIRAVDGPLANVRGVRSEL